MSATTTAVWELAEPIARDSGLEVLEIEAAGTHAKRVLRIYLDTAAGDGAVSIEQCQAVSRELGDVLEARGTIRGHYMLEVSSPGLDRPLRKAEHFRRACGENVRVRTGGAQGGRKNYRGCLSEVDGETLVLVDADGATRRIDLSEVERANVEYRFEEKPRPGRRR